MVRRLSKGMGAPARASPCEKEAFNQWPSWQRQRKALETERQPSILRKPSALTYPDSLNCTIPQAEVILSLKRIGLLHLRISFLV